MNPYLKLINMIPSEKTQYVEVISVSDEKTVVRESSTGSEFLVFGTGVAVGNKAFIKGGYLQGEAQDLPESTEYI